jgi:hypothetical protein
MNIRKALKGDTHWYCPIECSRIISGLSSRPPPQGLQATLPLANPPSNSLPNPPTSAKPQNSDSSLVKRVRSPEPTDKALGNAAVRMKVAQTSASSNFVTENPYAPLNFDDQTDLGLDMASSVEELTSLVNHETRLAPNAGQMSKETERVPINTTPALNGLKSAPGATSAVNSLKLAPSSSEVILTGPNQGCFAGVSFLAICRELRSLSPDIRSNPRISRDHHKIHLFVDSQLNLAPLLNISSICGVAVTASTRESDAQAAPRTRCKIYEVDTAISDQEIQEELQGMGVIEARRIQFSDGSKQFATRKVILIFNSNKVPATVPLGFTSHAVEILSEPRACHRCLSYNHVASACKVTSRLCFKCGESGHLKVDCPADLPRCINCEGQHNAYSNACPVRVRAYREAADRDRRRIDSSHSHSEVQAIPLAMPRYPPPELPGTYKPSYSTVVKGGVKFHLSPNPTKASAHASQSYPKTSGPQELVTSNSTGGIGLSRTGQSMVPALNTCQGKCLTGPEVEEIVARKLDETVDASVARALESQLPRLIKSTIEESMQKMFQTWFAPGSLVSGGVFQSGRLPVSAENNLNARSTCIRSGQQNDEAPSQHHLITASPQYQQSLSSYQVEQLQPGHLLPGSDFTSATHPYSMSVPSSSHIIHHQPVVHSQQFSAYQMPVQQSQGYHQAPMPQQMISYHQQSSAHAQSMSPGPQHAQPPTQHCPPTANAGSAPGGS